MNRSEQRRWVVKIIFQHKFNNIEDINKTLENLEIENNEFIKNSLRSILKNIHTIDEIANKYIKNKNIDNIPAIDQAILRVAINEFYIQKNIPTSVSINEAVEIAKEYSDDTRYKFINGVLSSIAKEMENYEKGDYSQTIE